MSDIQADASAYVAAIFREKDELRRWTDRIL